MKFKPFLHIQQKKAISVTPRVHSKSTQQSTVLFAPTWSIKTDRALFPNCQENHDAI